MPNFHCSTSTSIMFSFKEVNGKCVELTTKGTKTDNKAYDDVDCECLTAKSRWDMVVAATHPLHIFKVITETEGLRKSDHSYQMFRRLPDGTGQTLSNPKL